MEKRFLIIFLLIITICMIEGQINSVRFTSNYDIDRVFLRTLLRNTEGKAFSLDNLKHDVSVIENYLLNQGYLTNILKEVKIDSEKKHIEYIFIFPKVNNISISGNIKTREQFIYSKIGIKKDEILNVKKLEENINNLEKTGIFTKIHYNINYFENNADILIEVEEFLSGQYAVGLVKNNIYGLGGELSYSEKNFRGSGQTISISHEFGEFERYETFYSKPFILKSDYNFDISTSKTRSDKSRYTNDGIFLHDYQQKETLFFTGFSKDEFRKFERYGFKREKFSLSPPENLKSTVDWLEYTTRIRLSRGELEWKFAKTGGFLKGSKSYFKTGVSFQDRYIINKRRNIHFRFITEYIDYSKYKLEPFELLKIGGDGTLRGYKNELFSSSKYFLFNIENRNKINSITNLIFHFDSAYINHSLKKTIGTGLVFNLPIGNFRLNWAKPFDDENHDKTVFYFGLGYMF
ncbi:MAG: POTRA domain-containing protein [Candidatus Muiribacteriota bacterium]